MPQIDIQIDRPWLTLALIGGAVWIFTHLPAGTHAAPVGGDPSSGSGAVNPVVAVHDAEQDAEKARIKQDVLSREEDILRSELSILEQQMEQDGDSATIQQLTDARTNLINLLQDKAAADQTITDALNQIWDSEGIAEKASQNGSNVIVQFSWPVAPLEGISAHFNDPEYVAKFGVPHHAIDIPTPQGSIVGAAADGIVEKVSDQGMGFNSLIIRHANGMTTLYGHVIKFLVTEGQAVHAGEPVALSGGTPGTPGAGPMTTGAHLHLAFYKDGQPVDPMLFLPSYPGVK